MEMAEEYIRIVHLSRSRTAKLEIQKLFRLCKGEKILVEYLILKDGIFQKQERSLGLSDSPARA